MNNSTIIKALVAGGVVITGVLLSDNETVRSKLGKTMDILSDVEKAVKNPLGSFASSISSGYSSGGREMGYYEYQNNKDQRLWEMKKLEMQYKHDEEMAKLQNKEESNGPEGTSEPV